MDQSKNWESEDSVDSGAAVENETKTVLEYESQADQADIEAQEVSEEDAEREERTALARLFEHVRHQSVDGQLVAPSDWASLDLAPEHMNEEDFEMFTYEYLEEQKTLQQEQDVDAQPAVVHRAATRAVGVPQMFAQKPEVVEDAADTEADAEAPAEFEDAVYDETEESYDAVDASSTEDFGTAEDALDPAAELDPPTDALDPDESGIDVPEGFELVMLEGELTMVPIEEDNKEIELISDDITVLVGKRSYYLYSSAFMTDAFAHWAFLAREDDRIVTFVDCVRSESRIYPRPMAAASLQNDPFNMTDEEIEQTWNALRESGEYPDIETTVASNGEVYYFSTEHLSPAYAASLAEWHAVERDMYL